MGSLCHRLLDGYTWLRLYVDLRRTLGLHALSLRRVELLLLLRMGLGPGFLQSLVGWWWRLGRQHRYRPAALSLSGATAPAQSPAGGRTRTYSAASHRGEPPGTPQKHDACSPRQNRYRHDCRQRGASTHARPADPTALQPFGSGL